MPYNYIYRPTTLLASLLLVTILLVDWSSSPSPILNLLHTDASAAATGVPIDFVTVTDYGPSSQGQLLTLVTFGTNLSFAANNARDGINGRPLRLIVRNNDNNRSLTASLFEEAFSSHPNAIGAAISIASIDEEIEYIARNNLTVIQPLAYTRETFQFNESIANFIPAPDTELVTMMRHAVYTHQVSRVAVVVEEIGGFNLNKLPIVVEMIKSVGATLTHVLYINIITSPSGFNITSMKELIATNPHAIIFLGHVYANSAATFLALIVSLPNTRIYLSSSILPLIDAALRQVAGLSVVDRVYLVSLAPLYTDTSFDISKRFRAEVEAYSSPEYSLAVIDAYPAIGMYVYFGWIVGELANAVTSSLKIIDAGSLYRDIFTNAIYSIDDYVLGPFGGPCSGQRTQFCSCNNGARLNSLLSYADELVIVPVAGSTFTLPYTSCDGVGLSLDSILVVAVPHPANSPEAARVASQFLLGRNANAATGDTTIDGALVDQSYTGNSTAALQALNSERLLTASAGGILNTAVGSSVGIGALIDPMELQPHLYDTYRSDVVYVSPTYQQEIHALASMAIGRSMSMNVLSALDDGEAVGETLTRSLNTLGQIGGPFRQTTSIAEGLSSLPDVDVTMLHGITTSEDVAAIATHLGRTTSSLLAIPMAHLLVWYDELLAAVTDDSQRARIVFATSLPNWYGPIGEESVGPALQTYFDRVPLSNRTPGSLRGFMTHQFLIYVSSRIPAVKSSTEFLQMMYGASVVIMDTGLVVGPYFNADCDNSIQSSSSSTCEMNIGARLIRVRSLFGAVNLTGDISSITLESGRITYTSLPAANNTIRNIIIIVCVVGGAFLLGGIIVIVLVCCCSGRNNRTAPKDEHEAFSILFTDIQSSTALWAEASEAMAPALDRHTAIIRELCLTHNGYEVKTIGDAFMIAFRNSSDAVNLASAVQISFFEETKWGTQLDHAYLEMDYVFAEKLPLEEKATYSNALLPADYGKVWNGLRVRIGIHTGYGEIKKDPITGGYDYFGTVVNTAARTESIAHGGQIIITESTLTAAGVSLDRVIPMGPVILRGVPEPVQMYQLNTILNRVFPPLRVEKALEKDDGDLNSSCVASSQGSKASLRNNNNEGTPLAPAIQKQKTYIEEMLRIAFSVLPDHGREKFLSELCLRWRVKKQQVSVVSEPTKQQSQQREKTNKDFMFDAVATKMAPIWAKKVEMTTTGSSSASQSGHHEIIGGGLLNIRQIPSPVSSQYLCESPNLLSASNNSSSQNLPQEQEVAADFRSTLPPALVSQDRNAIISTMGSQHGRSAISSTLGSQFPDAFSSASRKQSNSSPSISLNVNAESGTVP